MPAALPAMDDAVEPVQLEPFVHQVGGHSSMLQYDDTTLCKPLISREHHFYKALPDDMKEFTPEYRGVIEVSFHEDSDGYITLTGHPSEGKRKSNHRRLPGSSPGSAGEGGRSDSDSESPGRITRQRVRMRRSGSIEVEGLEKEMFEDTEQIAKDLHTGGHNPWSLRCHKEQLTRMKKSSQSKAPHKFILLENVASKFNYPCILDLKMGTRQHGDDASEEKRKSQIKKCANSTSSSLGIRLCGMQVYQANTRVFICRNKYYGRKLMVDGFKQCLFQFMHDGERLLVEILDPILERLRQLYDLLAKQSTFRFYSSSLLIMYDGKADVNTGQQNGDSSSGKENANKTCKTSSEAEASSQSRVKCSDKTNSDSAKPSAPERSRSREKLCKCKSMSKEEKDQSQSQQQQQQVPAAYQQRVDVRMIDFAHTTHKGFRGDSTVHTGPDTGYLFGLENLINLILEIKQQYLKEMDTTPTTTTTTTIPTTAPTTQGVGVAVGKAMEDPHREVQVHMEKKPHNSSSKELAT